MTLKHLFKNLLLGGLLISVPSQACEIGALLAKDMGYGAAIGAGAGVLLSLSAQSTTNLAHNLGQATLIGAGAGGVVGIVELSFTCKNKANNSAQNLPEDNFSFTAKPMVTQNFSTGNGYGVQFSWLTK